MVVLFYINDIFDLFNAIYGGTDNILETLHLLVHADDTTIISSTRYMAERKIKTLMTYCKSYHISLQLSKCEFIVVNGDACDKEDIIIDSGKIRNVDNITLLGSKISESGRIQNDLNLHMQNRFYAVSKFYNFIRSNKLAPISVKLKVMEACVISVLLHNCETFGAYIPSNLETTYYSMIKACLNVRKNTPNHLALLESCMPQYVA